MLKNIEKKSELTRKHLLKVSLRVFEQSGYEDCTMRGLANEAGVTAPAFYYYFKSKDEIVSSFYNESLKRHLENAHSLIIDGESLTKNLNTVILSRLKEFKNQRKTLSALTNSAFNKSSSLSPFHPSHKEIRKESINLFEDIINKSKVKWPKKSKRDLAQLIWLYHLLIIFYWLEDQTPRQKKTMELLDRSLKHISSGLIFLRLPGAHKSLSPPSLTSNYYIAHGVALN